MKRGFYFVSDHDSLQNVFALLEEGFVLDPTIHGTGRPIVVEGLGAIYHMIKYEEGEEPEILEIPQPTDKFEGVVDAIEVKPSAEPGGNVSKYTEQGFMVHNILKGTVQMIKKDQLFPLSEDESTMIVENRNIRILLDTSIKQDEAFLVAPDVLDNDGEVIPEKVVKITNIEGPVEEDQE